MKLRRMRAALQPRGILLFEVLTYGVLMVLVFGAISVGVRSVVNALAKRARQEERTETWIRLSEQIRDDIRQSRRVECLSAALNNSGPSLRLTRADGSTVEYANSQIAHKSGFVRKVASSGKPTLSSFENQVSFTHVLRPAGSAAAIWDMTPVGAGSDIDATQAPLFLLLEFELSGERGNPQKVTVAATTRVEYAQESKP